MNWRQGLLAWVGRQWRQWPRHLGTLVLVVAVVLGVQAWQTRHVPAEPLPDLPLALLGPDGQVVATSLQAWRAQHGERAVALHVWAEWCPICRTEEGTVTALAADWPVLTVAMQSGEATQVQRVLRQRGLPWATAIDPRGTVAGALGVRAVPAFAVIDRQGRLRLPSVGYTTGVGMRLRLWWIDRFG